MATVATVHIWGKQAGAVAWLDSQQVASFAFDPLFVPSGLELSPIHMPLADSGSPFAFNALNKDTYFGLPGMLADSLPDKFGDALINTWLARSGRVPNSMNPVEKLCYIGSRGMGALEFKPSIMKASSKASSVDVSELVKLANEIMQKRVSLDERLDHDDAMASLLRIGTSAGGARPKAIVAINEEGHVLSGQGKVPKEYTHWLLKFDGVSDMELGETKGYGRIEYAYHLMAVDAGIKMPECKLYEEGGRAHFMAKRFDRKGNQKIHMQSLCGMAHYDFNIAGGYGYEQALLVMQEIGLSKVDLAEQFRRMVFNVIARNQDDHTKNIAFLMDEKGEWSLSPAFDLTYSHNPVGSWSNMHQMSISGKRDGFKMSDLLAVAEMFNIHGAKAIIDQVRSAVGDWPNYASQAKADKESAKEISGFHRLLNT